MFLKFCKIGYKRKNGRNHRGFIVFRRRGGFGLVVYRYIDFFLYLAFFLSYIVIDFCYDTCRNSFLMCVLYLNGVFSYRLGIEKVTCGSLFDSYSSNFFGSVNLIIRQPVGHYLCNIPFVFGKQIGLARSAGSFIFLQKVDIVSKLSLIKLHTKKKIVIFGENISVYGRVCNKFYKDLVIGKAGFNARLGYKSIVRGIARNPVDHPNGGRTSGGKVYRSYSFKISRSGLKTGKLFNNRFVKRININF